MESKDGRLAQERLAGPDAGAGSGLVGADGGLDYGSGRDGRGVVPVAVAVALVLATLVSFAGALVFDVLLSRAERPDLTQFDLSAVPFVLAAVSAAAVGLVLGIHRPAHPVGWLLGCLALSIGLAGLADGWSSYGALARPGSVAGAGYAAAYSVAGFVPWVCRWCRRFYC